MAYRTPAEIPAPVSERTAAVVQAARLGERLSEHRVVQRSWIVGELAIATGALAGVGFAAGWASSGLRTGIEVGGGMLLLGLIPFLAAVAYRARRPDLHVTVCRNGLIHRDGDVVQVVKWDLAQSVVVDGRRRGSSVYANVTVEAAGGVRVVLVDTLEGFLELVEKVEREIVKERLLPKALKRYEAGEVLAVGPLRISQAGVQHGAHRLRWHEVRSIVAQQGFLRVNGAASALPWADLPLKDIPNSRLFLTLAEHAGAKVLAS